MDRENGSTALPRNRGIVAMVVLLAGLFTLVGPAQVAMATPVTWHCTFGPAAMNTADAAYFTFTSQPGPLNDSLTIYGPGWCDRTITPPCPRGLICDVVGESVRAQLYALGTEQDGWYMHFGKCDADQGPFPNKLYLRFYLSVTMGSRHYLNELLVFPQAEMNPDFPGPGVQHGRLVDENLNEVGSVSFSTRLLGQCPPGGSYRAYFNDVTFTVNS